MRHIIAIIPTTNYGLASATERSDQMESFARVLMGLSHPLQLVAATRTLRDTWDWPKAPKVGRRWFAVIANDDQETLAWQAQTLKDSLEGVGFRCSDYEATAGDEPTFTQPSRDAVMSNTGEWCSSLVLRRWPREVAPGWLGQALSKEMPVDVGIHVVPQDAQRIARFLKKQQGWQTDTNSERPDAGNALGRADAEAVRLKLIAQTDKPCKVAVVLTVRGETRAQVKQRVSTLTHEIGLSLGVVRPATFEHDRGLEATSLTGYCNVLGAWRTLDCTSVASTWTFQPATIIHERGVALGTTSKGGMLFQLDPFDLSMEGSAGIVVAKKRVGKSYFMKILARGMAERGVEVNIIEQRNPAEYLALTKLPKVTLLNIADIEPSEQLTRLREFTGDLWDRARHDKRPRLLVVDEAWALLRDPELAGWIELVARTGGHFNLSLWIITQQVRELLATGRAALDNAEIRVFLKQLDTDLEDIAKAAGLSAPARQFLRGASRGQALFVVGDMIVPVDIAKPSYHMEITTDPRELQVDLDGHADEDVSEVDHAHADEGGNADDGSSGGSVPVWHHDGSDHLARTAAGR